MKVLKVKPTYHIKIDGPANIKVLRVLGKWITIGIECEKGTPIKWGTTRKVGAKAAKVSDDTDE